MTSSSFEQRPKSIPKPFLGEAGPEVSNAGDCTHLLYKNFEWYGRFGWSESPAVPDKKGSLPYYWPTKELTNG